jgi:hypothetical protein
VNLGPWRCGHGRAFEAFIGVVGGSRFVADVSDWASAAGGQSQWAAQVLVMRPGEPLRRKSSR